MPTIRDLRNTPEARASALLPAKRGDWAYIRAQYEANLKSVQLLAAEAGVSPTAIYSTASAEGWTKNPEARTQYIAALTLAREAEATKALIVERDKAERVNAEMQARVLVQHRDDISHARSITRSLMKELKTLVDVLKGDANVDPDGLSQAADINKKLSDSLKTQIQLERQAFGIVGALEDPETPPVPGVGQSDIDKILGKFNLVIQTKSSPLAPQGQVLGEVIDVPP